MKKKKKFSVGQNINVKDGEWTFEKIEKKFEKHINTSVPFLRCWTRYNTRIIKLFFNE